MSRVKIVDDLESEHVISICSNVSLFLTDTQDYFTLPVKRKKKNQKFVEEKKRPKLFVEKNKEF